MRAFISAMVCIGSVFAQPRFIPTAVINAAFGITTLRPAYYLQGSAADSTGIYLWAIGDYTNTRNNYDSLGFHSALWHLRFSDSQWIALDRLPAFPEAGRWVLEVNNVQPLIFSQLNQSAPRWWWGWMQHDTTKVSPTTLPSQLLAYTPSDPSPWRLIGLPSLPGWQHDRFEALNGLEHPPASDSTIVLASTYKFQYDPTIQRITFDPQIELYTGSRTDTSLKRIVGLNRIEIVANPDKIPANARLIPICFNPALGADGALYSPVLIPSSLGGFSFKPILFIRFDLNTNDWRFVTPKSGLTQIESLQGAYAWSHDSCIYVLCTPQTLYRLPEEQRPIDSSDYVGVFRYNVFTGHCERISVIRSRNGNSAWLNKGTGSITRYREQIAVLGTERVDDSLYTAVYFLRHTPSGTIEVSRLILTDVFPTVATDDIPYSLTAVGHRLIITRRDGLFIYDTTAATVQPGPSGGNVLLYPQPAQRGQVIRCILPTTHRTNALTIRLFDVQGRVISLPITLDNNSIIIPTDNLACGAYWVVITDTGATTWFHPIIIE